MTEAPVLALPNFDNDFVLETDASGQGMGAVLTQGCHPICYYSKKFSPKMLSASTYVRELCAITSAVKKWHTYLLRRKFAIHTDQRSLRELMTQVIQTPEQQFYLSKLLVILIRSYISLGRKTKLQTPFPAFMKLPPSSWPSISLTGTSFRSNMICSPLILSCKV